MLIKGIIEEDFINYKKVSMVIEFPSCSFKCDKEYGSQICQNSNLAKSDDIQISLKDLVQRYLKNDITHAIVMQGLEPFDSISSLYGLMRELRIVYGCDDDIVIYTGYTEEELSSELYIIKNSGIKNIIIKFGRYIPNQEPHYDDVLGVKLASDNQYAKRIC